jgi:glycosyltransferase involved in cell wall biosynthesis
MSVRPFFSVLIPTYNQAHYLKEAIEGVLKQSFSDFELVILDDHSADNTAEVVQVYLNDSRVRYIQRLDRLGRVKNYRTGVDMDACGTWIVICDGDDYYTDPDFLQRAHTLIGENDESLVLLQGGHWYGTSLQVAILQVPSIDEEMTLLNGVDYVLQFAKIRHFSHLSSIYKAEVARRLGAYSLDILSSDMNTLLKLAVHGKVLLLKSAFGLWRQHDSNASSSSAFAKRFENLAWIEDCTQYFQKHPNLLTAHSIAQWRQEQILVKYVDFFIEAIQLLRKQKNTAALRLVLNKLSKESGETWFKFFGKFFRRIRRSWRKAGSKN